MTRPIILLDVDGVLCDFVTPVLSWANEVMLRHDFAHNKSLVQGDAMVEDNAKSLMDWDMAMDTSPHLIAPCLWDAPYNQGVLDRFRVKTWDKVIANVRRVAEELA